MIEYNGSTTTYCKNNNWLFKKTIFWTISSYLSNQKEVFIVYSGAILNGVTFNDGFVFSTLYLSPNIKINGGNGNVSNPYVLSM